ncbi:MAG: manganese efflux pump [Gammaproteobacteria bacterium]|nr:manganese efflux pump [Gammaproteobacteria bacterium]
MNVASTLLLAFAMSADAFAAAVGSGAALHKPSFREAIRTGTIFGLIEGTTPIVGWLAGKAAYTYISEWDHWIAFTLLTLLGLRLIFFAFKTSKSKKQKLNKNTLGMLLLTGFSTSIDAMVVGVSLALINAHILWTALAIGLTTTLMVTVGVMVGRLLGVAFGKGAEIMGGIILVGMGSTILYTHLTGV